MSNYIQFLRQYVGHQPLLQCAASVIVENDAGQILLQQRTDNHCWGYAGGAIELKETVEEAAKRELYEETGIIADELELFSVFSGQDFYYQYPNQDEVYNIDIVFICKKYHGELKADPNEVEALSFFDLKTLPEPISPPVAIPLQKYIAYKTQLSNL